MPYFLFPSVPYILVMNDLDQLFVPFHRIIPFSNVEGQGNRTSIFLQGCKLNCLYCHNPETIPRKSEDSKLVSLAYLYEQVQDAMPFIRGVTFSGGEPTIHHKKLIPLVKAIKGLGLTCYVDTSGFFEYETTAELIGEVDQFLFDLKGMGLGLQTLCFDQRNRDGQVPSVVIPQKQTIKDRNLNRNLYNLDKLLPLGKIEEVRLVMVNTFFDSHALIEQVASMMAPYPEVTLKLIRAHSHGARDPEGLMPYIPSVAAVDEIADLAKQLGVKKVIAIY